MLSKFDRLLTYDLQLVFRVRSPTISVRILDNLINCIIGVEIYKLNSWKIRIQSIKKSLEASVKRLNLLVHLLVTLPVDSQCSGESIRCAPCWSYRCNHNFPSSHWVQILSQYRISTHHDWISIRILSRKCKSMWGENLTQAQRHQVSVISAWQLKFDAFELSIASRLH